MPLTIGRVFVNKKDKKGYIPTPEECYEIQQQLAQQGINIQTSIKNFYKDDIIVHNQVIINSPENQPIQVPPTRRIKLIMKDGVRYFRIPTFLIPLPNQSISEICFPHNIILHTDDLCQVIEKIESVLDEKKLVFRCGYDTDEKNLQSLHSSCLLIEFFQKIGWKVSHFLNDGISEPGIAIVGYTLGINENSIDEKVFRVYIHFQPKHAMITKAYDSLRIPTGHKNPASLLAISLTEKSMDSINDYYQFYFDYNFGGKDMIKIAFTQLNDVELDPFHDYLVEYIGRAITTPWTNNRLRLNVVKFLTSIPNRPHNFEKWMFKTYSEAGKTDMAYELLEIIKNNIDNVINKVPFDEKFLINAQAEKWWVISRLNDIKYKEPRIQND